MFGYDSKLKLKELLLFVAEQELAIEKMRQILAAIRDFEPYAAFKRLDRNGTGYVGYTELCQFERENGFREVSPEDFIFLVSYFDLDQDGKLNYHDFLQILLPCDNPFLRSAATQRPNQELYPNEFLPMRVERAMSQLIFKEVKMHLKAENIKRSLESSYDFSVRAAFKAIDDWNYNYIDKQNLKRFLRSMGHLATKQEIVAILRRFDLDGDAKINMQEFGEAIKTKLGASKPVQLRTAELEAEKVMKGSQISTRNRSVSKKRMQSASQRMGESPRHEDFPGQPRTPSYLNYGSQPASILKSNKPKRSRPKTAGRASSVYNPNRNPQGAAQGVSFSPHKVGNVAMLPVSQVSKQQHVQFQNTGGIKKKQSGLPQNLHAGMGYLQEGRNDAMSPVRDSSPTRVSQQQLQTQGSYPQNQDIGYMNQGRTSPLRHKSPRRDGSQSPMARGVQINEPQIARSAGMSYGSYDRVEQSEFAKVLKDNIFLERELESAKIETALKPDFNLLDAFKMFDSRGHGNISVQDVMTALRDNICFNDFTHDDVYLLFRRHDGNADGKLNFTEFSNMLLPVSKEYSALLTDRPDFYMSRNMPISQFFNSDTRNEIRNLWLAMFKCERACEVLRVGLRKRAYFNLKHAFSFMDQDIDGYILVDDIREFLANNGFFATERELAGIMQKCDKDGDGRISFNEFVDEFSPKLGF